MLPHWIRRRLWRSLSRRHRRVLDGNPYVEHLLRAIAEGADLLRVAEYARRARLEFDRANLLADRDGLPLTEIAAFREVLGEVEDAARDNNAETLERAQVAFEHALSRIRAIALHDPAAAPESDPDPPRCH